MVSPMLMVISSSRLGAKVFTTFISFGFSLLKLPDRCNCVRNEEDRVGLGRDSDDELPDGSNVRDLDLVVAGGVGGVGGMYGGDSGGDGGRAILVGLVV